MTQLPERPLNILLIEDSDTDRYTIRRIFSKSLDQPCNLKEVYRMKDAEVILVGGRAQFDVILLDLGLPDTLGGRDTYDRLEAVNPGAPVIILSNVENHELAIDLVANGASDFVRKSMMQAVPECLCDAVGFAVCRQKNFEALQGEKDRLLEQKDQVIGWMTGDYSVQK